MTDLQAPALDADAIRAMPAGPEMGTLVAERVMGWPRIDRNDPFRYAHPAGGCIVPDSDGDPRPMKFPWPEASVPHHWRPSELAEAAWHVVEAMRARGWSLWVGPNPDTLGGGWAVQYKRQTNLHGFVHADTAPLAICRAALLALIAD